MARLRSPAIEKLGLGGSSQLSESERRQRSAVLAALTINAVMFVVELAAAVVASSTVLLADAIDMFADALALGLSLVVVGRGVVWECRAARLKGCMMIGFGVLVLMQAAYKTTHPALPQHQIIEVVAVLALVANLWCIGLLAKHRRANINMRSLWLCSRNDVIANLVALSAGVLVWLTHSQWPDVITGGVIAALCVVTGRQVLSETNSQSRQGGAVPVRSSATSTV